VLKSNPSNSYIHYGLRPIYTPNICFVWWIPRMMPPLFIYRNKSTFTLLH